MGLHPEPLRCRLDPPPGCLSLGFADTFDLIEAGDRIANVTGIIELTAGIALLIPSAAIFGAMLLIPTMIGAIVVNVFVVPASPVAPLVLLLLAAAVAWARRDQLRIF